MIIENRNDATFNDLSEREAHLLYASELNQLAILYRSIGDLKTAEFLLTESFGIREHIYGFDHVETAKTLMLLAQTIRGNGRIQESETLRHRALATIVSLAAAGNLAAKSYLRTPPQAA